MKKIIYYLFVCFSFLSSSCSEDVTPPDVSTSAPITTIVVCPSGGTCQTFSNEDGAEQFATMEKKSQYTIFINAQDDEGVRALSAIYTISNSDNDTIDNGSILIEEDDSSNPQNALYYDTTLTIAPDAEHLFLSAWGWNYGGDFNIDFADVYPFGVLISLTSGN